MTVRFRRRLADAWDSLDDVAALAVVPLLTALFRLEKFQRIAAFDGVHVGIRLPFPAPILDAWGFVNVPSPGGGTVTVPGFGPPWALPLFLAVEAALAAGYLGSLNAAETTGSYDFLDAVREYFVDFLVYEIAVALPAVAFAVVVLGGVATGGFGVGVGLVLLSMPVFFAAAYLFYAAPFLVVVEDRGAVSAFVRSADLALEGGDYAEFFLKHVAVGAAVSIPATLVASNLGVVGGVLAAAVLAPVGLAFTFATLRFVRDHVGVDDTDYLVPLPP